MTRMLAVAGGLGLLMATMVPMAAAQDSSERDSSERRVLELGGQVADKGAEATGPNPYLALVPDPAVVDYASWRRLAQRQSQLRSAIRTAGPEAQLSARWNTPAQPIDYTEREAAGATGENDTVETAERVRGYGTRVGRNNRAVVTGSLAQPSDPTVTVLPPGAEDNGSRPLATDTGLDGVGAIRVNGRIGDGPHGRAGTGSGDFDFYRVEVPAGHAITARTRTPVGPLDTMLVVYDDQGEVAFNDDARGLDSEVSYIAAEAGTYWVMVTGYFVVPGDPDDSASGSGAQSQGRYRVDIGVSQVDLDTYSFPMRKGDVLGVSSAGGTSEVRLLEPDGELVMGSSQNLSFIYSIDSPLPGSGDIVAEHVADQAGWHHVVVAGSGDYQMQVESYRPALERNPPVQTLFIDFDGERINTGAIWGGAGNVDLSPFEDFIEDWGIGAYTEDALIDVIVDTVRENVKHDLQQRGDNPRFRIRVTNSRDHDDTFGDDHVSRVIVGGTIEESGIPTIGIAQSIDPGNFGMEESALVLMDVLSGDPDDFGDATLNYYIEPQSDVIKFVGTAIGNVVSHEAGHFFGNFHVDQFNDTLNLMDQGGNFPLLYGVGDDGIGGTDDDPDVDFGEDDFNPGEGFIGTEDTLTRLSQVLRR